MSYNTATIRELLDAVFDDEELTALCYDHFRPVHKKFAAGISRLSKIQLLIDYCERHDQFNKLLALVEKINRKQYDKFIGSTPVPSASSDFQERTHPLSVIFEKEEEIHAGNNTLRLVVHNTASVDCQHAVIRLKAPSGISLLPNKLEVSPLLANSSEAVPVTLYAAHPGVYQVGVRVSPFPVPKEGILHTKLQVDVLPQPETLASLEPEFTFDAMIASRAYEEEGVHYRDIYSPYEAGLRELLNRIGKRHPRYSDTLIYQQRLKENIAQSRKYGDTEARKAERAEIIDRLNELALSTLGTSFSELCE